MRMGGWVGRTVRRSAVFDELGAELAGSLERFDEMIRGLEHLLSNRPVYKRQQADRREPLPDDRLSPHSVTRRELLLRRREAVRTYSGRASYLSTIWPTVLGYSEPR